MEFETVGKMVMANLPNGTREPLDISLLDREVYDSISGLKELPTLFAAFQTAMMVRDVDMASLVGMYVPSIRYDGYAHKLCVNLLNPSNVLYDESAYKPIDCGRYAVNLCLKISIEADRDVAQCYYEKLVRYMTSYSLYVESGAIVSVASFISQNRHLMNGGR